MRDTFHALRLAFAAVAAVLCSFVVARNQVDPFEPIFALLGLVVAAMNAVAALGVRRRDEAVLGFSIGLHATNVYGAVIALVYLAHGLSHAMQRSDLTEVAESFAIVAAVLFMIPLYRTYRPADEQTFTRGLQRGIATFIVLMLLTLALIMAALG